MSDYSEFLKVIKRAAVEAVEAGNPTSVCYGQVTGDSPLKIVIDQKMTLTDVQLIVPEHLTDHEIEMTLDNGETEKVVMHCALKKGDMVILIREQGGQKFIVLDRMVKT